MTSNGKVDRAALATADLARPASQKGFAPPSDYLEAQLVQIWEEVLHLSPIGVTDNFFDLGGHSMLAVRLMSKIEEQFSQSLPLSTLFRGATIKHLAGVLREQAGTSLWSPLVAIQPDGWKRPFFGIHPIGGSVTEYYDLGRHIGRDQPFYAIQAESLEEMQDESASIEEMAAHYIEIVRAVQPEGPYQLGGHSFGGVVAFEMAQQLIRSGQKVGLLAILDTPAPLGYDNVDSLDDAALLVGLAIELASQYGQRLSLSTQDVRQLEPDEQLSYILDVVKNAHLAPAEVGTAKLRLFMRGFRARERALRKYKSQPYPGRVTLFQASEYHAEIRKNLVELGVKYTLEAKGWNELATEPTEIHIVPGFHETITYEPHVKALAEKLKDCLDKAHTAQ